ncbi:TetR family transcriptional regulator [Microtetraspora sp. NBRC 13810]|uniref:TetR/AcrR family transcriptional regulator n=1 Tax=Microtetraspora sp. NBRC 13810 TaxID=3030990 RepID=UPI0024A107BC|nr:TetR/AcrR family transcriptional regulator [Microtetraspora sp. NBRC 13810]GLW05918.1 TetR family transcriptional regulator [Microtetraspora sp. NBRC 13810]
MSAVDRLLAGEGQRPRADARRNLERLVAAARAAVAEVGVEVTAHEIAQRAGVGIGTFYRRVSSRESLLESVLDEVLGEAVAAADQALGAADPWQGFHGFATAFVRLRAESCGVGEALGGACGPALDRALSEVRERIRLLVERAQAAGLMRPDVAWQDVAFLLAAVATGPSTIGLRAGDLQWSRNLQVVLDGLRTTAPSPLPGAPPSQMTAIPTGGERPRTA